jgi:peptide/nickel transport system permease protein
VSADAAADNAIEGVDLSRGGVESGASISRELWLGGAIVVLAILGSVVARLGVLGDPNQVHLLNTLESPSWTEPFGTDAVGRSVLLRTIYATSLDLWIGVVTTGIPLVIGMLIGIVAGYRGGVLDAVLMRVMDAILAFPFVVLIIAFVAVFGVGLTGAYVGLTVASVPFFARITRGEMLVLKEQQFILAAQTLSFSTRRILLRHALPHLIRPNLVIVPPTILGNILTLAALSYLGLGVQPPTPEWGAIIANGQSYLFSAWWISTLPGLFVVLVGIGLSLLGDGLVDRWHLRRV